MFLKGLMPFAILMLKKCVLAMDVFLYMDQMTTSQLADLEFFLKILRINRCLGKIATGVN